MSRHPGTALVAGGAGFIGSHLAGALLARGWQVLVVDNLVTGRLENLADYRGQPGLRVVEADITEPLELAGPIDAIFNLASPASPADFTRIPIEILLTGTLGTHRLLELAREHRAVFLQASTSEVYGDPLVHPQVESYRGNVSPVGPRSCYDEAKRAGEALTMAHHRRHRTDTRIARIFNTYGPRMRTDDGRVVPNFISQVLAGRPMTVYGDGTQTRSLCHVDDLVAGLLAVFERGDCMPYNLGNPHEVTMLELAAAIAETAGVPGWPVEHLPLPEDDPRQRRPDISRARAQLGWEPVVALTEGLAGIWAHFTALRARAQADHQVPPAPSGGRPL